MLSSNNRPAQSQNPLMWTLKVSSYQICIVLSSTRAFGCTQAKIWHIFFTDPPGVPLKISNRGNFVPSIATDTATVSREDAPLIFIDTVLHLSDAPYVSVDNLNKQQFHSHSSKSENFLYNFVDSHKTPTKITVKRFRCCTSHLADTISCTDHQISTLHELIHAIT